MKERLRLAQQARERAQEQANELRIQLELMRGQTSNVRILVFNVGFCRHFLERENTVKDSVR